MIVALPAATAVTRHAEPDTVAVATVAELEVRFAEGSDPSSIARLADENTRAVFVESLGNPSLNVVDLRAWADAAHEVGVPLIVDNTVATPILCRPIEFGADIVVQSLTKFIGGHGTSIGGMIIDSGNFDWPAHSDRFPGLTEPDPSPSPGIGAAATVGAATSYPVGLRSWRWLAWRP